MLVIELDDDLNPVNFGWTQSPYVMSSIKYAGEPFGTGIDLPTKQPAPARRASPKPDLADVVLTDFTADGNWEAYLNGFLEFPLGYHD